MSKIKLSLIISLMSIVSAPSSVMAEELTLDELWQKSDNNSALRKSFETRVETQNLLKQQSKDGFLPQVYLGAKMESTNSPTSSFFNKLSERQVESADFSPSQLNHPDREIYSGVVLGAELNLYKGGADQTLAKMYDVLNSATMLNSKSSDYERKATLARLHSLFGVKSELVNELQSVSQEVDLLIKNYRLGQNSSLLGHSGSLGLKGLKNRLNILTANARDYSEKIHKILSLEINQNEFTLPKKFSSDALANKLEIINPNDQFVSTKIQAQTKMLEVGELQKNLSLTKLKPKLDIFFDNQELIGKRGSAYNNSFGLKVSWELFGADHKYIASSSDSQNKELNYRTEHLNRELLKQRMDLISSYKTLQRNEKLIADSISLLDEQFKISKQLFSNGTINILTLTEVISRRVDLIESQYQVQEKQIEVMTSVYSIN